MRMRVVDGLWRDREMQRVAAAADDGDAPVTESERCHGTVRKSGAAVAAPTKATHSTCVRTAASARAAVRLPWHPLSYCDPAFQATLRLSPRWGITFRRISVAA